MNVDNQRQWVPQGKPAMSSQWHVTCHNKLLGADTAFGSSHTEEHCQ